MKIQLYSDIVQEQERIWMQWEGNEDAVSFQSIQKALSSRSEDDKKIEIFINCKGGDCIEGWAIYDLLRQQTGCEIFATIEGECSSMASIILLAAPVENRKAFANAHLCIHNPAVGWFDTDCFERLTEANIRKTAEQILNQAESLHAEQQKILDTYVERTGTDAETLQALMDQDIYVNMTKAQELGFISSILAPTTARKDSPFRAYNQLNLNNKTMNKTNDKASALESVFTAIKKLVGIEDSASMKSLSVTDVDGNVVTIEREEGDPQVGDAASPDGSFVLEDGRTIVVEGGVITEIVPAVEEEPEPEEKPEEEAKKEQQTEEDPEDKKKQKCEVEEENQQKAEEENQPTIEELQNKIAEMTNTISELTEKIKVLTGSQASAEQKSVLEMVEKAGGKDVVENALNARSTFNASNTKQVERNPEKKEVKLGDSYLEDQKAAHAAALAKIRK